MGAKGQSQKARRQREAVARRSAIARGLATADVVVRGPDGRGRGGRAVLRLPAAAPVYDALIESCSELTECADALDAEVWLTQVWDELLTKTPATTRLDLLMLDLVDEAERAATAGCLVLLHTMAVLDVRGSGVAARAAAQRLTARRGDQPDAVPWLNRLGAVSLAECHRFTDVFGEQVALVCEFEYSEQTRRHAVLVALDLTNRGALSAIELTVTPASLSDALRRLTKFGA